MSTVQRASSAPATRGTAPWPLVVTGALAGLTWAAALRGWMIQMAGDATTVHWYGTFGLVLAPGVVVGAAFGLAEHRRRTGGPASRWLTLAPLAFLAALADPTIFRALITNGFGGGAIGVMLFGLAGGYAASGNARALWRWVCGTFAVLGVLLMLVMASETAPLGTPHGTWVGLYAASLMALLCLACAIPHRIDRRRLVAWTWVAVLIGALCGFAWTAALRAFMTAVAGPESQVTWSGTFGWVLLPGTVIGALLAWAEHRRQGGSVPYRRWLVASPMLFAALLVLHPLDVLNGVDGGVGLGAVGVPAYCMIGGYAIAGRGPVWVRTCCALVALSAVPIWALTASAIGGERLSLSTPHGAWAAVLYWGLLATFSVAAAVPHRRAVTAGQATAAPADARAAPATPPA